LLLRHHYGETGQTDTGNENKSKDSSHGGTFPVSAPVASKMSGIDLLLDRSVMT
jgi:hypothetical protein